MKKPHQKMSKFPELILNWYDQHARDLPWRVKGGGSVDPYHVWLSEIMLQQTTVPTVGPYFQKFLSLWPTVNDLALAPLDDVLTAWAGLGYYARARNLYKCAVIVRQNYGGIFPKSEDALLELPGIGPYTAAAIAAIAFDQPAVVVDGNIERIITRVFRLDAELPKGRPEIAAAAGGVTPKLRAGDYAQALMDIGSRICSPKKPKCNDCPVSDLCVCAHADDVGIYPKKAPKKQKPNRSAIVLWICNAQGQLLLRRRPEKGLLGGMMEFPSTEWRTDVVLDGAMRGEASELLQNFGLSRSADTEVSCLKPIKHTFTHFHLHLHPYVVTLEPDEQVMSNEVVWALPTEFTEYALPTLMKKVEKAVAVDQPVLPLI
jgi:A/G-specific adenine glycosylase